MSGLFKKHAVTLVRNGYTVVPIPPKRKGPVIEDWLKNAARTPEQANNLADENPKDGVGILTRDTPAVDIDCLDQEIVDAMLQWCSDNIGDAPLRIGNAPKSLLLYVADKPFSKITSARYYDPEHPERDPKRKGQRLEVLGEGQQFVAYHIHPDTGRPYEWVNDWENPLEVAAMDLPVITAEHARLACREFERLCEAAGWKRLGTGSSAATDNGEADDSDPFSQIDPPDETEEEIERVRSALKAIEGDVASTYDYDQWRNVLFALKWTRWDCAESLAREWSETSDKHVTKEFNVVWRGAQKRDRGREITLGTMFRMAKDAGWDSSRAPTPEDIARSYAELLEEAKLLTEADDTRAARMALIQKMAEVNLDAGSEGEVLKVIKAHTGTSITDMRRDLRAARRKVVAEVSYIPTHAGYAENLIDRLDEKSGVAPVGVQGMIYVYSQRKGVWEGTLAPDFSVQVAKQFDGQENCTRRADYMAIAQHAYGIISAGKDNFFHEAPVGLACTGRFYSVNATGGIEKEELDHTHRQRVLSPVKPVVGEMPKFKSFLAETFAGEGMEEQIALLQEVVGSIILGTLAKYEKVVLFKGPGRSGKGTMMKIIEAMLPAEVVSAVSPFRWNNEYYLANLAGKRLNLVGELPDDEPIPAADFKTVTGRDKLEGRHPSHRPFSFRNEAAHLFNTNHYVYTKDHSEAFYGRWILLSFHNSRLGMEDGVQTDLAHQIIAAELPQIMAWALQGAKRIEDRGYFEMTSVHKKMMAQWRHRTNTLIEFLLDREVCTLGSLKTHVTRRSLFYEAYVKWCSSSNRRPMGKMKLYDEMDGYGVQQLGVRKGSDDKSNDVIRGLRLTSEEVWIPDDDDEL